MNDNAPALLDASLLLFHALGAIQHRFGDPAHDPWFVYTRVPADVMATLDELRTLVAATPAWAARVDAVIDGLDAIADRPIALWFEARYDRARAILSVLHALSHEIVLARSAAGEAVWRPLPEGEPGGSGLERSTRRQSYRPNLTAG